ncbi:hypothetical protein [Methylocella sp.]
MGSELDFWDDITFAALAFTGAVFLGLPGRIAIARRHPEAEAVHLRESF